MTAPIPRSPGMRFSQASPPRPSSPETERIPFPYCYTEIIMPEEDRQAHRERFMAECNMRRWAHIHQAKLPVKR